VKKKLIVNQVFTMSFLFLVKLASNCIRKNSSAYPTHSTPRQRLSLYWTKKPWLVKTEQCVEEMFHPR
jgi:hypothetical protein